MGKMVIKLQYMLYANEEGPDQTTQLHSLLWVFHYENTPIQIYRKFHHQKLKTSRLKTLIFFIFLLKT